MLFTEFDDDGELAGLLAHVDCHCAVLRCPEGVREVRMCSGSGAQWLAEEVVDMRFFMSWWDA